MNEIKQRLDRLDAQTKGRDGNWTVEEWSELFDILAHTAPSQQEAAGWRRAAEKIIAPAYDFERLL